MKDLMIDLETLGQDPECVVLSLGAVFFDTQAKKLGKEFYAVLEAQEQIDRGRSVNMATIKWWFRQGEGANELFAKPGHDVSEVLDAFAQFAKSDTKVKVWGNGSTFDISIMENLYTLYGKKVPWTYYNVMDLRTFRRFVANNKKVEVKKGVAHNAVDDARAQAQFVLDNC